MDKHPLSCLATMTVQNQPNPQILLTIETDTRTEILPPTQSPDDEYTMSQSTVGQVSTLEMDDQGSSESSVGDQNSTISIVVGTIGSILAILLVFIIVLLLALVLRKRMRNSHKSVPTSGITNVTTLTSNGKQLLK